MQNDQKGFTDQFNWQSYQTTGLNDAIASGHEIMVRTKNYYGLNLNKIGSNNNTGPLLNSIQEYLMS